MSFIRRNGPILAFAILAVVTAIALRAIVVQGNDTTYRSEIQQCERNNATRAESNRRIHSHRADTEVLKEFIQAARIARLAAFHHSHQSTDEVAARTYGLLVTKLNREVRFNKMSLINCQKVIPKP